jgi:hypothetical protein
VRDGGSSKGPRAPGRAEAVPLSAQVSPRRTADGTTPTSSPAPVAEHRHVPGRGARLGDLMPLQIRDELLVNSAAMGHRLNRTVPPSRSYAIDRAAAAVTSCVRPPQPA